MDKLTITIEGLTDILKAVFKPVTKTTVPPKANELQTLGRGLRPTTPPAETEVIAPPITTETEVPAPPAETEVPAPPITTETEVPAPPATIELDENGVPWDVRINTSTKGKTAKGVWKRKPGIEDDFYNGILSQLKAAQAVPAPTSLDTVTQAAAMMAETPPPAHPAPSAITTFAELSEAIMTKGIPNETVTAAVNQVGLQSYLLLGGRLDLVPEVAKLLGL